MRCPIAPLLVGLLVLAGCGTADDRAQATRTVERFYDAVRADRGAEACAQLSAATASRLEDQSGQACREAVTRLEYDGGAVVAAQVFVTNAKVDLRGDESAFLAREPTGWKLTAVGCKAEDGKPRDRPFACQVEA